MLPPMRPDIFHECVTLVLKNNIFHFQNTQFFRQIKGTAMGASISVFYANTFMYSRTKNLIYNPPRELEMFVRYIDDLFGIYKGNPLFRIARALGWLLQSHLRCRRILGECRASFRFLFLWSYDPIVN